MLPAPTTCTASRCGRRTPLQTRTARPHPQHDACQARDQYYKTSLTKPTAIQLKVRSWWAIEVCQYALVKYLKSRIKNLTNYWMTLSVAAKEVFEYLIPGGDQQAVVSSGRLEAAGELRGEAGRVADAGRTLVESNEAAVTLWDRIRQDGHVHEAGQAWRGDSLAVIFKWATQPLFCSFSVFFKEIMQQINVKNAIQYMVLGFELTTFRT